MSSASVPIFYFYFSLRMLGQLLIPLCKWPGVRGRGYLTAKPGSINKVAKQIWSYPVVIGSITPLLNCDWHLFSLT